MLANRSHLLLTVCERPMTTKMAPKQSPPLRNAIRIDSVSNTDAASLLSVAVTSFTLQKITQTAREIREYS